MPAKALATGCGATRMNCSVRRSTACARALIRTRSRRLQPQIGVVRSSSQASAAPLTSGLSRSRTVAW